MPEEDPYTSLAVAIGRLEEGQKHVLTGIEDIKTTLSGHDGRLSDVERKTDVLESRVETVAVKQETAEARAEARKPPWTAIGAFVVGALALTKQFLGF